MTLDDFDAAFQRLIEEDSGVSPLLQFIRGSKGRFPAVRARDTQSVANELYLRMRNDPRGPMSWPDDGSGPERLKAYIFGEAWDLIREWLRKEYRRSKRRISSLELDDQEPREPARSPSDAGRETLEYWQSAAAQCLSAGDLDVFIFITHSIGDAEVKPDFERVAGALRAHRALDVNARQVRDRWRDIKQRLREFEADRQGRAET